MPNTDLRSILLIDDSPSDILLTKRAFQKANIVNPLVVIEDGQEALDYLLYQGPYEGKGHDLPSLILLDLKLPGVDGLEILRVIRSNPKTKRLLVVILTSSKEEQDRAASYDLGVNSYIRKPVDFTEFVTSVSQMGMYWLIINEAPPL